MRCFDQFSNVVMEDTYERHIVDGLYGDIPLGLYMIRGDSIVLAGELDTEREEGLKQVSVRCDLNHLRCAVMMTAGDAFSGDRGANPRGREEGGPATTPHGVGFRVTAQFQSGRISYRDS